MIEDNLEKAIDELRTERMQAIYSGTVKAVIRAVRQMGWGKPEDVEAMAKQFGVGLPPEWKPE